VVKTRGLAHISIPVSDPERSCDFYCKHLGMKLLARVKNMVFLDAGGDCVILVGVEGPISTAGVADVHQAFIVAHDEYEAAVRELRDSGVAVTFEEDRRGGVVNGPRAYFNDPDGNALEIIDLTSYCSDGV
jgi:catechol 2,3-dioxygenase-like lactoylglutathione lyase family enzyme